MVLDRSSAAAAGLVSSQSTASMRNSWPDWRSVSSTPCLAKTRTPRNSIRSEFICPPRGRFAGFGRLVLGAGDTATAPGAPYAAFDPGACGAAQFEADSLTLLGCGTPGVGDADRVDVAGDLVHPGAPGAGGGRQGGHRDRGVVAAGEGPRRPVLTGEQPAQEALARGPHEHRERGTGAAEDGYAVQVRQQRPVVV